MSSRHVSPLKKEENLSTLAQGSPIPPGCKPVPVRSLLGTGPHSRRWAAEKWAKLHLLLAMARITAWTIPPTPSPSMENLSSTKRVAGAKNIGDHCFSLISLCVYNIGGSFYEHKIQAICSESRSENRVVKFLRRLWLKWKAEETIKIL